MARDRLAALRAQQEALRRTAYDFYPSQDDDEYLKPRRLDQETARYEMSDIHFSNVNFDRHDMSAFYSEISSIQDIIKKYNDNVSRISDLHSRSLNYLDENVARRNAAQIDGLVEQTSALSKQLKVRIKNLQKQGNNGRDGQIRKQQIGLVKHRFVEAIQNYQQVEHQFRAKYKQRMERQFKTIKPDATPEEVKAVVNSDQGAEIFAQSLQWTGQYSNSRAAYREVQGRHEDIRRIERTLRELARLFNDMGTLVEQQDQSINTVQAMATYVEKDAGMSLKYAEKAVNSARAARKKKWLCIGIAALVALIVIGSIVAVAVTLSLSNNNY